MSETRGKIASQEYYENMLFDAIQGMNVCISEGLEQNGERVALEYIKNKLSTNNKKNVIFDVGANVGNYTDILLDVFKDTADIYSFEPSLKTFNALKNRGFNGPRLFNIGFGDKIEEKELYTNGDLSGIASLYKRRLNHFGIDMNNSEKIKIDTIDNFCTKNNIDDISFLKLDVEGNELKVLNGAQSMLKSIRFIQFEFGGCNIDSKTYFQDFWYLFKDRYKLYRIVKDGLFEIRAYKEMYELFMMTNFLAERVV